MDRLEKTKYALCVFEGVDDEPSEIQVRRIDCGSINKEEVEDLKSEFAKLFPKDVYGNLNPRLKEDDEELHINIGLAKDERHRRTKGVLGKRVIVSKTEIEERLKSW